MSSANQSYFYILTMTPKNEIKKTISFTIALKRTKEYLNKWRSYVHSLEDYCEYANSYQTDMEPT